MRAPLLFAVLTAYSVLAQTPADTGQKPAPAPPPEQTEQAPIRIQVNEVIVPVTVTDDKGRFVSNLDRDDFKIYDQGREQRIAYFTRERNQPVVVGFLLDLSNTSKRHWDKFREAAEELVWTMLPVENNTNKKYSGYLITYSTDAELAVNTTSQSEPIVDKIRKLKPGGGSALYDAIYLACTSRNLVQGEPIEPRRVIVIIGDGNDNASKNHTLDQVIEIAQRNLVTIYGVSTKAFGFQQEGENALKRLAEETGGRVEYPLEGLFGDVSGYLSQPSDEGNYAYKVGTGGYAAAISKGIMSAIANVTGEVTTQYILRYIPNGAGAAQDFREIKVEVPSLPGLTIRVRKGYYPAKP